MQFLATEDPVDLEARKPGHVQRTGEVISAGIAVGGKHCGRRATTAAGATQTIRGIVVVASIDPFLVDRQKFVRPGDVPYRHRPPDPLRSHVAQIEAIAPGKVSVVAGEERILSLGP